MKASKTTKENKAKIKSLKTLKRVLTRAKVGSSKEERAVIVNLIEKTVAQIEFYASRKRFLYNFNSGGWNSSFGVTLDDAYRAELKRWGRKSSLASSVDRDSFRIAVASEEQSLMRMFD